MGGCKFNPYRITIHELVLMPEAWKAVGKVKHWRPVTWYIRYPDNAEISEPWMVYMHGLIDVLQLGKTLEEYIETL